MILLIIRHGESEADLLDVHEGRADFPLTERGHRQAQAMAEEVRLRYSITQIYASTLTRARQTVEHLSKETGAPVTFDEKLMEFNNGCLAGLPRDVARKKYPPVTNLPPDQSVYGQESLMEFRKRADDSLNTILQNHSDDETVAVVTHGGMISQLYHSFLNLPVNDGVFFGTGDTGIHVWKTEGNVRRILKANMTEHIHGI